METLVRKLTAPNDPDTNGEESQNEKLIEEHEISESESEDDNVTLIKLWSKHVGDHTHYCKNYKNSFYGWSLVEWMLNSKRAKTREEAASFGKILLSQELIFSADYSNDQEFYDDRVLYQFTPKSLALVKDVYSGGHEQEGDEMDPVRWVQLNLFAAVFSTNGIGLMILQLGKVVQKVEIRYLGVAIVSLGILMFLSFVSVYVTKIFRQNKSFRADITHPVKSCYLAGISISILQYSLFLVRLEQHVTAIVFWAIGSLCSLLIALEVVGDWFIGTGKFHKSFSKIFSPVNYIPAVTVVFVAFPAADLGEDFIRVGWLFWGVSLFYWLVIYSNYFSNALFVRRMGPGELPVVFINIAPPSLVMLGYISLNYGSVDHFAQSLFGVATFMFLLVSRIYLSEWYKTRSKLFLTWTTAKWALVFPMSVYATCAQLYYLSLKTIVPFVWCLIVSSIAILFWLMNILATFYYLVEGRLFSPIR